MSSFIVSESHGSQYLCPCFVVQNGMLCCSSKHFTFLLDICWLMLKSLMLIL